MLRARSPTLVLFSKSVIRIKERRKERQVSRKSNVRVGNGCYRKESRHFLGTDEFKSLVSNDCSIENRRLVQASIMLKRYMFLLFTFYIRVVLRFSGS